MASGVTPTFVWRFCLAPVAALALLTGMFGLLPPRIEGLAVFGASYCACRMILFVLPGSFLLGIGVIASVSVCRLTAMKFLIWSLVIFASGIVNIGLDQDPAAACLNYRAPFFSYDRELGHRIERNLVLYPDESLQSFSAVSD